MIDEYVTFNDSIKMLAESAGRAFGAIVAKFKHTKGIGYNAYRKLYECGIAPILDYAAEVGVTKITECVIKYKLEQSAYFWD